MIKKYINKQSGLTLIELLAVLALSTMIIGLLSSALITTVKHNIITQAHINLRQEANLITTKLRSIHQGEKYKLYYENGTIFLDENKTDSLASDRVLLKGINGALLKNENGSELTTSTSYAEFDPSKPLLVTLTLVDKNNKKEFEIDTVIERLTAYNSKQSTGDNDGSNDPNSGQRNFYDFIQNDHVFVYGSQFTFSGGQVNGANTTMIVLGDFGDQINGGASINVSNIYINGSAKLDSGQQFGSNTQPGNIYVNGDLTLGSYQHIYGDVYVNGDLKLIGSTIEGTIFVNGNVELGWTPNIKEKARIYYTGTESHPKDGYPQSILNNVIHQSGVTEFNIL